MVSPIGPIHGRNWLREDRRAAPDMLLQALHLPFFPNPTRYGRRQPATLLAPYRYAIRMCVASQVMLISWKSALGPAFLFTRYAHRAYRCCWTACRAPTASSSSIDSPTSMRTAISTSMVPTRRGLHRVHQPAQLPPHGLADRQERPAGGTSKSRPDDRILDEVPSGAPMIARSGPPQTIVCPNTARAGATSARGGLKTVLGFSRSVLGPID